MPKVILTTQQEKEPFFNGMNKLADAVTSTLGVAGKTIIISKGWGANTEVTKDGYNTAFNIQLEDWIEDAGANMIKGVAKKTVDVAGDNTTTATLLAQYLINNGVDSVNGGCISRKVKEGIDASVKIVIDELDNMSIAVGEDYDKIKNIATISANNDEFIGKIIGDAYKQVGSNTLLLIEESETSDTWIDTIKGAEFQSGYFNEYFINNKSKMRAEYKEPLILVFDYEIKKVIEIEKVLSQIAQRLGGIEKRPIIIFAHDFDGEMSSSAIKSNNSIGTKILLVKAPSAYRKEFLKDICAVTGATFISDNNEGLKPQDAEFHHIGYCDNIISTNATTTILGGKGENFEEYKELIKVEIANSKHKDFKEVYTKRLAQISGSIGIIKVGGATQVEMQERKDRIDDAVRATKCAIEEGVIPGGGKALLSCIPKLELVDFKDYSMNIGKTLVQCALRAPINKMCENAGIDKDIAFNVETSGENIGYNFKTNKMENLVESGVLDATKVVKSALLNASSLAGQVITTGSFIIEVKQKN